MCGQTGGFPQNKAGHSHGHQRRREGKEEKERSAVERGWEMV